MRAELLLQTLYRASQSRVVQLRLIERSTNPPGFKDIVPVTPNQNIGRSDFELPMATSTHVDLLQISRQFFTLTDDMMVIINPNNRTFQYEFVDADDHPIDVHTTPLARGYVLKIASHDLESGGVRPRPFHRKEPVRYVVFIASPFALQVEAEQKKKAEAAMRRIHEDAVRVQPFDESDDDFAEEGSSSSAPPGRRRCIQCGKDYAMSYYLSHLRRCRKGKCAPRTANISKPADDTPDDDEHDDTGWMKKKRKM